MLDIDRWAIYARNTILHPLVTESWGGGAMPEQHWGYLLDHRPFYLRLRHNYASLCLGGEHDKAEDLPLINPEFDSEAHQEAFLAGRPYEHSFFLGPRPDVEVYPGEDSVGWFRTPDDRADTFAKLLNQLLGNDS